MKREKISGGIHTVQQLLADGHVLRLYVADNKKSKNLTALVGEAQARGVPVETVALYEIEMMLPGVRHQGVAALSEARGQAADWTDAIAGVEKPLLLVLDSIQDPHNLGACLRTADAMGVHAVIAPKDRSAGLNATVSKVACGAAESLPYITVTNLARTLRELKEYGIWIVGTDMGGEADLFHYPVPESVAWVMGNEGEGMRRLTREHCDALVSIPMYGSVESMNVSVSTGMVLAETRRQRSLKA